MTEPTELLPCPFCGGINIIHCCHHMYCHACGADGPDADSQHESEAIAAWNTRATQPTQAQAGAVPLTPEQITAAAKKLAECMEYPWDHMPEQGRAEMRKHARAVLSAANCIKGGQHGAAAIRKLKEDIQ